MKMKAKLRNKDSIASNIGSTRRVYLPNSMYDNLVQEAGEGDVCFSELIRRKIKSYDKIKNLILKEGE